MSEYLFEEASFRSRPRHGNAEAGNVSDDNEDERSSSEGNEVEEVPFAEPALCKPEMTTVPLDTGTDPNVFIFPNCVRIERCGGCCNHELLQCEPIELEKKRMKIIQTTMQDARYF